jgi:hypothetical protein
MDNTYTTRFIDTTPELFEQVKRQDRATKLLTYIADVTVNGHPETKGRPLPAADAAAPARAACRHAGGRAGTRQRLDELGPKGLPTGCAPEARADDRHDHARRPPVAAGDPHAHPRHRADRRCLCAGAAGASVAGMLGRRDLRRADAVPDRGSVGAAARDPRQGVPNLLLADAAARRQRRRLQELSRQCGQAFRAPGSPAAGSTCSACSTASTGSRTCACRWTRCARRTSSARQRSATPATF